MIYVAIASVTPRLATCASESVVATTADTPTAVRVAYGPEPHGVKLDRILHALPADATWFVTLDDDAAFLRRGWFGWLRERMGDCPSAGFDVTARGTPAPMGALYRVDWLRDLHASFAAQMPAWDVAAGFGVGSPTYIAPRALVYPWWLDGCAAVVDEAGRLVWAHLGGGTIGATNRRIPTWSWPWFVRRHLCKAA